MSKARESEIFLERAVKRRSLFSSLAATLLLSAFAFSPALAAAPPKEAAAPSKLTGIWFGKGQPDDPNVVYLDYFAADGTFKSEFRVYQNCMVIYDDIESGTWTSKGNVQSLVTTQINGKPDHIEHAYTIESVTGNEVRARLQSDGYLFVEQRVDRFIFPICVTGS